MEKRITAGTADFLTTAGLLDHSVAVDTKEEKLEYSGIVLEYLDYGRYATTKREQHTIIVGDTGCGKTRRVIIPSVKLLGKTGESMIISDPKGELYRKTADELRKKGYEIHVLNMRNPRNGDRWNPLTLIEDMYFSPERDRKDRGLMMLDEIIDLMGEDVDSERDRYWCTVSKQFIRAVSLTILEYAPCHSLSFSSLAVAASVLLKTVEKRIRADEASSTDSSGYDEDVRTFLNFLSLLPSDSVIRQSYESTTTVSSLTTFTCISSQVQTMINMFVREESVRFLFSSSDFDIASIGEKSTVLYIVLPDEMTTLYPLATLFVHQIYSVLIDEAFRNGGKLNNRVTFILDEFANFTRLRNISSVLTASRSRGMRFVLVIQDIDQLEATYGSGASSIIYSSCQNLIFMGCRNVRFLRELEALGGIYREKYTGDTRPLITVSDLQSLEMGEAFIFIRSCSPRHCFLPDYTQVRFSSEEEETASSFPLRNLSPVKRPVDIISLMRSINEGKNPGRRRDEGMNPSETIASNASAIDEVTFTLLEKLTNGGMHASSIASACRENYILKAALRILITRDCNSEYLVKVLRSSLRRVAEMDLREREMEWSKLEQRDLEELLKKGEIPDTASYCRVLDLVQKRIIDERGEVYIPEDVDDTADAEMIDGRVNYQNLNADAIADLKAKGWIYLRGMKYTFLDYVSGYIPSES